MIAKKTKSKKQFGTDDCQPASIPVTKGSRVAK